MIADIRHLLSEQGADALIITRTDSFLGEYFPPESENLKKATGFSGSAGLAVVTQDQAVLFVDSRYTEQAKIESAYTVFEVPTQTTVSDWLTQYLPHAKILFNPWHRSALWVRYMTEKKIGLHPIGQQDWQRLFPPQTIKPAPAFDYDYAGEETSTKIKRVVQFLAEKDLNAYIFTSPDSVSYLLNRRSLWVPDYPVVFERWIVFRDGTYRQLKDGETFSKQDKIGMDLTLTPDAVFNKIARAAHVVHIPDPVAQIKAIKNKVEQDHIRRACLFESTVLCRFLAWVEQNKETIDELACAKKLQALRRRSPLYRGDSFDTIAAVGPHAALAHYQATEATNTPLSSAPILLVDTGGNYLNGTTDMTRTICTGQPTPLMKKRYTQVLKGHIALATTPVKVGDLPARLDQNARQFLRADGVDYGHATGHGIGLYLAVHEAPPTIYEKADTPLLPSMLFSNEPAFYDPDNGYGIRLENMILTRQGSDDNLILENLLWVPFDGRLVNFKDLTDSEKAWLRIYHHEVAVRIFPHLTASEQQVLQPLLDFFA